MQPLRTLAMTLATLATLAVAGCSSDTTSAGDNNSQGSSGVSVPTTGKYGQVKITGAVTITAGFLSAQWSDFPGDLRADLSFGLCTVVLNVPHGTQPGTYPIGDEVTNDGHYVAAEYGDTCNSPSGYPSTAGTLTLTSLNPTWAGSFDFTGRDSFDSSKTVHVTGTFKDVPKV